MKCGTGEQTTRLIDAENLMTVTDICEDGTEITYVPYSEIESAPTAYDVDKVVATIKNGLFSKTIWKR